MPPPPDLPAWSTATHVRWASVASRGERAVFVDVPGGDLDRLLADPDVATVLNDQFETIFLHPAADPDLTARLGWPSVTALAPDGCVRVTAAAPPDAAALIDVLNAGLRARRDDRREPLPEPRPVDVPADPHGWSGDGPFVACPLSR